MVELRINSERVDLKVDVIIALTYAINDIGSIETRQGVSSNQFDIPITDRNLRILGYPTLFNINQNVSPFKKIDAEIYEDELRIAKGYIQIDNPSLQNDTIPVNFFGENADVFNEIKGKSIRELDLSDFKHQFTVSNVESSFTNSEGYKYILVDKNGLNFNQTNKIALQCWTLSVFQKTIVSKIFSSVGFKISGDLLDDPMYNNVLIADTNKRFRPNNNEISSDLALNLKPTEAVVNSTLSTVNFIVSGNNSFTSINYNDATDTYTSTTEYYARLLASVRVENTTSTADYELNLNINGTPYITTLLTVSGGIGDQGQLTAEVDDIIIASKGYVLLSDGDTVNVTIRTTSGAGIILADQGTLSIGFAEEALEGIFIEPSAALPDITQDDFIKDVVFDLNALITVNLNTMTVSLNKRNYNVNNALDFSNKIDLSEDIEINYTDIISDYNSRNFFKRKESDDAFIVDYNDSNIVDFGNYEFFIDNDFLDKEGIIYESPFSSVYQVNSFNLNIYLPYFANEIISETFTIDSFSSAGVNGFQANSANIDVSDFEDYADQTVYLLVTDSTVSDYNGIFSINSITTQTATPFVSVRGQAFTVTGTAIGRLVTRGEKTTPRKLIDGGNFDVSDLSNYTELEVNSLNDSNVNYTSVPYAYFFNPIIGRTTDATTLSLSYGEINLPSNCSNLVQDFYQETLDLIQSGKMLKASFRLTQVDIFNLDFNKLIYLNFTIKGQTINGYFILNKIEEYSGNDDSTVVELIKY